MHYLQQILNLPFAHIWLPGAIFVVVVLGFYWFLRPKAQLAAAAEVEMPGAVQLTTPTKLKEKAAENRQANRRPGNPVDVLVSLPDEKSEPEQGAVLDRSVGGLRLAVFHEVATGTVLAIRPATADDMVPWVEIAVRSCRASSAIPGEFELGCQFVKSVPYSIMLLFG